MFNHEHFQRLSALAVIGQLSSEENRELNQHLLECPSCQEIYRDYAHIVEHELPQADEIRWRIKSSLPPQSSFADVRDRFLARARAEGIDFSPEVHQKPRASYASSIRFFLFGKPALAAAAVAVFGILAIGLSQGSLNDGPLPPAAPVLQVESGRGASENQALDNRLAILQKALQEKTEEARRMLQDHANSNESVQKYEKQLADVTKYYTELSAELQQIRSENAALSKANHDYFSQNATLRDLNKEYASTNNQKDSSINELRARNQRLNEQVGELAASQLRLQSQVHKLNGDLLEQTANLDRERQLNDITKDVRGLMGARNLHIIDVHDVSGRGTEKAFGRVFYAVGQSLIFYAFDLPSEGRSPAKYAFQVWGQQEAGTLVPRNLGTFEIDDQEQRRWVLKVNNPRLLTAVDSVFVTAEPRGDVDRPHGQKLMYAYLAGQANHP